MKPSLKYCFSNNTDLPKKAHIIASTGPQVQISTWWETLDFHRWKVHFQR
jgi:hypothetical protein